MKFEELAKRISEEFTHAWNNWDIEKVEKCLTKTICVHSPHISQIYPENIENFICGREKVIAYWKLLMEKNGRITVTQTDIKKVDNTIISLNKVNGKNIIVREVMTIDEYGKIKDLAYEYFDEESFQEAVAKGISTTTVVPCLGVESK